MGHTTLHRSKGISHKDWFQECFGSNFKILDAALKGCAVYMAVERKDGKVFAAVAKISWAPKAHHNFCYKLMDETVGPNESRCPQRILDLLSSHEELGHAPDSYAIAWRDRCEAYIAHRKSVPRVSKGALVQFATAMTFGDGIERDLFLYSGRGSIFADAKTGKAVRITNWRDRAFTVIATEGNNA